MRMVDPLTRSILESDRYECEYELCEKHEHQGGYRGYQEKGDRNNTNPSTEPPQLARHPSASQNSRAALASCGIERTVE
jgi:hypothetical protein